MEKMLLRSFESFSLPFVVHELLFESVLLLSHFTIHIWIISHISKCFICPLFAKRIMQCIAKCIYDMYYCVWMWILLELDRRISSSAHRERRSYTTRKLPLCCHFVFFLCPWCDVATPSWPWITATPLIPETTSPPWMSRPHTTKWRAS